MIFSAIPMGHIIWPSIEMPPVLESKWDTRTLECSTLIIGKL